MEQRMSDESTDLESEVVETPTEAEEVEVETTEPEPTDMESEDTEDTEEESEPEEIEFDLGGGQRVKFNPNATAKEIFEQAQKAFKDVEGNLTRKHQEVAETRKSLEASKQAVEKLQALNGETLDMYSRGLRVREDIEQLSKIDVGALWQSDPDQARRVSDALSRKQAEFQQIVSSVSQKEVELSQAQKAEITRAKSEGEAAIERQIKGFKAEKLPAVIDYAVNTLGLSKEAAENDWALNPAMTVAVHKAMLFDKMQAEAKKKAKPATAQAQPVEAPKPKGAGKASYDLVKDADKMSADEWARKRNQQLAKRRQA